jgi:gustatory receptor
MDSGPLSPSNIVGVIFFSICVGICVQFFKLAQKWRNLMIRWTFAENDFMCVKYEKPPNSWSLRRKILTLLTISCSMALIEHLLSNSEQKSKQIYIIRFCNLTIDDPVGFYIIHYQAFLINNLPFSYNNFVGVVVIYLNASYTFYWNFLDIFTILISIGLSDLFGRLNYRLERIKDLQLDEHTW